jgi:membrane-associated protease RseP (regulator of RpoE activity)
MVLKITRVCSAALLLAVTANGVNAQVGRGVRGRPQTAADTAARLGRGIVAFRGFNGQAGGPRPLLFGFALECTKCQSTNRRGGLGGGPMAVWHYDEFPRIVAVADDSPAARAGIREGDLLLGVDGASLITDAGARLFSALRAGDTASLTLERNGKSYSTMLVLDRPPGFGGAGGFDGGLARGMNARRGSLHFSTRVGTTAVDVESEVPVVSSTDSSGATVLHVGSTTIRLRAPTKAP